MAEASPVLVVVGVALGSILVSTINKRQCQKGTYKAIRFASPHKKSAYNSSKPFS